MHLRSLAVSNFRLYKEAQFDFSEGINGIIGENAVGKTSILEALYIAIAGRSFRTANLKEVIREGTDAFRVEIHFTKNGIDQKIRILQGLNERSVLYNSTSFSSFSALLGILQGVLFAPHDLDLIKGPPLARRLFLDMQLAQVDPLYVHYLQRFNRAMKQRNTLLKTKNLSSIEPFEMEMAISAAYLSSRRAYSISLLAKVSNSIYNFLTEQKERLELQYKSSSPFEKGVKAIEEYYLKQYRALRGKELEWGYTLMGPQKDDISIQINGKEARLFASEGQKHTAIAALKFAEWSLIADLSEDQPLMIIDDFTLSLDEKRQAKIFNHLDKMGQACFSSTIKPKNNNIINWINISY